MTSEAFSPSIEARLGALERQVTWWRRAAGCTVLVLGMGALMAFKQLDYTGPLEASSLTLQGVHGAAVTLTLSPQGNLEARFAGIPARNGGGNGITLVNPAGREVIRLGGR